MSICTAPINIATNLATPNSNMLVCNYYEGDCETIQKKNAIRIKYATSDQTSNVVYKGKTYILVSISLYRKSLHAIDGKYSAGELIMVHMNSATKLYLCICIPVSINLKNTSFGTLLKRVPSKVHSFQSPKTFIPSGVFYSYVGSSMDNCAMQIEYIVFPSSNVNITSSELKLVPNNSSKLYTGPVTVYKHSQPTGKKAISFGDDKLYIDCQPIDAPESSGTPDLSDAKNVATSINFSDLQHNKFVQMLLMFIIFMIVMVIFFYSYEFTTGMFRELTKSVLSGTSP